MAEPDNPAGRLHGLLTPFATEATEDHPTSEAEDPVTLRLPEVPGTWRPPRSSPLHVLHPGVGTRCDGWPATATGSIKSINCP
jgi:hypothetical protein